MLQKQSFYHSITLLLECNSIAFIFNLSAFYFLFAVRMVSKSSLYGVKETLKSKSATSKFCSFSLLVQTQIKACYITDYSISIFKSI